MGSTGNVFFEILHYFYSNYALKHLGETDFQGCVYQLEFLVQFLNRKPFQNFFFNSEKKTLDLPKITERIIEVKLCVTASGNVLNIYYL